MTLTLGSLTALLLPATGLLAIAILIAWRLHRLRHRQPFPVEWLADLSPDRYRPMLRLLNRDDLEFLSSQPGATPALIKRVRQQRCQIFRGYLQCLQRDFRLASDALMIIMIQSETDRRDLIPALVGTQLKFAVGMFVVRCRLAMYRYSIAQQPVVRLVSLFEGLQLQLQDLSPASQGARA